MKTHKHPREPKKARVLSVKDLKVCFGKCRCFSADKAKFKTGR